MKKRIILIFGLLIITIVSVLAVTVFADTENEDPTLTIKSNTLELENAVFMNYKIDANGIEDESCVKLLVWESAPAEYTKESAEGELSSIRTEEDTGYLVFQYDDLAAKDMTKFVYVCAYAEVDGVEIYSNPVKFSIVQYAYNMLNSDNVPEYLEGILTNMLEYGAFSQLYFNHNTDFLATDEVSKIKVVNGTHADGFKTGYYKAGTSVTITANEAEEGYVFSHWTNSAGEEVGTETILTIPECVTETYTAVYEEAVKYSEGLAFTSNGDGTCYVSGIGTCTDTEIVIPPVSPEGDKVVAVGDRAFKRCNSIESVTITNGITSIGFESFYDCYRLSNVTLGEDVNYVGAKAFDFCSKLENIYITDLSQWCEKIVRGGIYSISLAYRNLYCNNELVTDLVIPEDVTTIAGAAFYGYSKLSSVTIHKDVKIIGNQAFNASGVKKVFISDLASWCEIEHRGGNDLLYYGDLYFNNELITSLDIPEGVTKIGKYAFSYCSHIKEVTIPSSVTVIEYGAFRYCGGISQITLPNTVKKIEGAVFEDCKNLISVKLPDEMQIIEYSLFRGCRSLTSIIVPSGVTSIGNYAFENCAVLTTVTMPTDIKSIGDYAFKNCQNLMQVNYIGSQENWVQIEVGSDNTPLDNCVIKFNYSE